MKKTLLICSSMLSFCLYSQTYTEKEFQQSVSQTNNAKTESDYDNVFRKFSMFSSTKPTDKWEAYYYAAAAMYLKTELHLKKAEKHDDAESNAVASKFINAANAHQNNAEINILLGLIAMQKIQVSNNKDIQKELDFASEMAEKAGTGSPNNPRLAVLKAKLQERTGNKANAEQLFRQAKSEFETKDSSGSFAPDWGRQLIQND